MFEKKTIQSRVDPAWSLELSESRPAGLTSVAVRSYGTVKAGITVDPFELIDAVVNPTPPVAELDTTMPILRGSAGQSLRRQIVRPGERSGDTVEGLRNTAAKLRDNGLSRLARAAELEVLATAAEAHFKEEDETLAKVRAAQVRRDSLRAVFQAGGANPTTAFLDFLIDKGLTLPTA